MSPRILSAGVALAALAVAACVPRTVPPEPAPPPPAPAPAPPPPAPPAPPPVAWEDSPPSPGDWSLDGAAALYGPAGRPAFILRCEGDRHISLIRTGAGEGALTVRTTIGDRALPASGRPEGLTARLAASDPLLDSIVFSRGRFAIEAPGLPRLIIPTWPEPARVIEDCRD